LLPFLQKQSDQFTLLYTPAAVEVSLNASALELDNAVD